MFLTIIEFICIELSISKTTMIALHLDYNNCPCHVHLNIPSSLGIGKNCCKILSILSILKPLQQLSIRHCNIFPTVYIFPHSLHIPIVYISHCFPPYSHNPIVYIFLSFTYSIVYIYLLYLHTPIVNITRAS